MLINRIDLKKSLQNIFKEQIKYYPQIKKSEKNIIDIIFEQRTFEEGPGYSKKKIHSGYNIQILLKTGKRSEDGSLVGFRSSLIGDLYNVCCEFSKLKIKNNKNKISKKNFYQNFLKEYLNSESIYYKNPKKTKFSEELNNFKIYSFDFKKFADDNDKIIDTTTKIPSETNNEKEIKLIAHINKNIKITFLNLIFNIQTVNKKANANDQKI